MYLYIEYHDRIFVAKNLTPETRIQELREYIESQTGLPVERQYVKKCKRIRTWGEPSWEKGTVEVTNHRKYFRFRKI